MTTTAVRTAVSPRAATQRVGSSRRGTVLCLMSAAGFGLAAIFARETLATGASLPMMLMVRFVLAAAVFWAVVAWRRPAFPTRGVLLACIALGSVGYALQAGLYFGALTQISASLTALLLYIYPALVTVLAIALRRESPDRRRIAALACSISGLLLLLGAGGTAGSAATVGVLLALGAAVAYALYLTVAEGLPKGLDLYLLSAIVCTAAAVSHGTAGVLTGSLHAPTQPIGWLWIGLLALISTVIPMAGLFAGVREVGASTAAILSCAEPAVTVASTALVYGERLSVGQAIGGVAVLAAVLVLRPGRRGSGKKLGRYPKS